MSENRTSTAATTLDDVARRAGVSKFTVSAVLNRTRSNTRVSAATRERIMEVATELSYRPNAVAQSLRNRRTNLIGLYNGYGFFDARNRFLSELLGGLQEGCSYFDKDLIVYRLLHDKPVDEVFDQLIDGRVDGVVLFAPTNDVLADRLAQTSLPVIAIADALPQLPSVVVNDAQGGVLQARHLAEKGHRRVLYRANPFPVRSVQRRFDSFCTEADRLGMRVVVGLPEGTSHELSANERAILLAPLSERPTAAVCWEDAHADRLLRECRSLGLRVPQDLAVIGFDHLPLDREPAWNVTTIHAPWAQVALRTVELLVAAMAGETIALETVLPVQLFQGETT